MLVSVIDFRNARAGAPPRQASARPYRRPYAPAPPFRRRYPLLALHGASLFCQWPMAHLFSGHVHCSRYCLEVVHWCSVTFGQTLLLSAQEPCFIAIASCNCRRDPICLRHALADAACACGAH